MLTRNMVQKENSHGRKARYSARRVAGIPSAVVDQLAEIWLTTAEELVSAARRWAGKPVSSVTWVFRPQQVDALVNAAMGVLPDGVAFDEEAHRAPLGALPSRTSPAPTKSRPHLPTFRSRRTCTGDAGCAQPGWPKARAWRTPAAAVARVPDRREQHERRSLRAVPLLGVQATRRPRRLRARGSNSPWLRCGTPVFARRRCGRTTRPWSRQRSQGPPRPARRRKLRLSRCSTRAN